MASALKEPDPIREQEHRLFKSAASPKQDAVITVLRVHLLTENYLERLIQVFLPRGDRVINEGKLTYSQKLALASSFDVLNDKTVQCLKGLNKLRNQCAHGLNKKITMTDVETLGRPLGRECTKYRRECNNSPRQFLYRVLGYTCGFLSGQVILLEAKALKDLTEKKEADRGEKKSEQEAQGDAS